MIKFQILNSTSLVPLVVMPDRVHADPITAMLGAALGGGKVAMAIAGFLVNTLASMAFSAISMMLSKKSQSGGLTTNQVMQGEGNAQRIILGRYATAGNDVAPWYSYSASKTPNDRLVYIRAWADHPIDGIDYFVVDGKDRTFDPVTGELADLEGKAWVRGNHDGRQTTADAFLIEKFADHPDRHWTPNHKLIGVAYSAMEFAFDQKQFPTYPEIKAVLRGMRLYDPRKDSTVPGGSGSHRWADQSTHEWTSNPIIAVYNTIRGLRLPGDVVYGIGAGAADIPLSSLFAAANQCDLAGDDPSSTDLFGDTKRYQFGLEFGIDTPPLDVIGEILASCGGKIAEVGGQYYFSVGSPELAVASINDGDVLLDHNMDESPFLPLASRNNYIGATYPDPKNAFAETAAVPISNAAWEIEDDNRRLGVDLKLSAVPFPAQVRRIMRTSIADHRRQRIHTITLGPWAAGIKPLQNISWTSPGKGYSSKLFEVQGVNIDAATLNTTLNIKERDPADYNVDAVSDSVAPNYANRDQTNNVIEGVQSFLASATTIKDANGVDRRPAIKIEWDAMPDGLADGIAFEIRLADNTLVLVGSTDDIARGEYIISESILPDTQYRVYSKVIAANYVTAFGSFVTVTTDPVFMSNVDLGGVNVKKLINDAGLSVPEIGSGLPTSGMINGDLHFNTANNKMYRFDGALNTWVPLVGDIEAGSISIPDLAGDVVAEIEAAAQSALADKNAAIIAANNALNYSLAANAHAIAANTFRASAQTFSIAANTSAILAANSALNSNTFMNAAQVAAANSAAAALASNTAKNASETARTQAQTAASTANGHAVAAAGSANLASASANTAGNHASAAAASVLSAQTAANTAQGHAAASLSSANSAAASASAANTSAAASSASAIAANTARGQAQTFSTSAASSATAANTSASLASTQAGIATSAANTANGHAVAASTSAANAASFANSAGTFAAAANTAKTAAETARGQAQVSANNAASSATSAAGSASMASTSASTSATALADMQVGLNTTSRVLVTVPLPNLMGFGTSAGGLPATYSNLIGAGSYGSDEDGPYVQRSTTNSSSYVLTRALAPVGPDSVLRVSVKVKASVAMNIRFNMRLVLPDGNASASFGGQTETFEAGEVRTITCTYGRVAGGLVTTLAGSLANWTNAIGARFGVFNTAATPAENFRVYSFTVDDVTDADLAMRQATLAAGSASAAATSSSSAAAFANSSGQSANAASASALAANTSRGQAQTFATSAATSAQDANNSASLASTQSGLAVSALADTQRALASGTQVIAGRASTATLPFGTGQTGFPDGYVPYNSSNYGSDSDGVFLNRDAITTNNHTYLRALVEANPDKVFKITARVKATADMSVVVRALWINPNGSQLTSGSYGTTALTAGNLTSISFVFGRQAGGLVTVTGGNLAAWTDAAFVRFGLMNSSPGGAGAKLQIYELSVEDLTEADMAARQAILASGSATAAQASATNAAAFANASAQSAAISANNSLAANTARSGAEAARDAALVSMNSANGSAASAATQAGISASALDNTRLALASGTSVIAGRASTATLPFGAQMIGLPQSYTPYSDSLYGTDSDGMYVQVPTTAPSNSSYLRPLVPSVAGKVYRVTAKVKLSANNNAAFVVRWLNANGTELTAVQFGLTAATANTVLTLTQVVGSVAGGLVDQVVGTTANWNTAAHMRFGVRNINAVAGGNLRLYELNVEDVTEADMAARSATLASGAATAAANSATAAQSSANSSAQSATAAQTNALAANTARGQAQTFSTSAASSASAANTSASLASTQAGIATTSANSAATSATAAANSATVASTSANSAGTFAAAASTSALAANTARSGSELARDQSVTAAANSSNSATSALASSTLASRLAGQGAGVLQSQFFEANKSAIQAWHVATGTYSDNLHFGTGRQVTWNITADSAQAGLQFLSTAPGWVGPVNADAYVVELDFVLNSGAIGGAGILFRWFNTSTYFQHQAALTDMVSGPIVVGQRMTARGVFVRPAGFTGVFSHHQIFLMANYTPFPNAAAMKSKNITFDRFTIRPASAEEQGLGAVDAQIKTQHFTKAESNAAMATMSANLTAQIGTVDARVANVETNTFTKAQTNSAIAGAITNYNASVPGGLTSTVQSQTTAIADINGKLNASFVMRVKAGGASAGFEMVAASNPTGSASAIRMDATEILLNGSVKTNHFTANSINANIFTAGTITSGLLSTGALLTASAQIGNGLINNAHITGAIQSNNFVAGVSGWQINKTGSAEFNNLIVRKSLVVGSVSDLVSDELPGTSLRSTNNIWVTQNVISLGASASTDYWMISLGLSGRRMQVMGSGKSGPELSWYQWWCRLGQRVKIDGVWSAWSDAGTMIQVGSGQAGWLPIMFSKVIGGEYEDIEFAFQVNSSTPAASTSQHNVKNVALMARRITR